mgnify:CR=1 FL=1
MPGHVGVYLGKGRFAECAGAVGMTEGSIKNKAIVRGSKFTNWFKDVNITYSNADKEANKQVSDAIDVLVKSGIISSPDYWLKNYDKVLYLDLLIKNMASYINNSK